MQDLGSGKIYSTASLTLRIDEKPLYQQPRMLTAQHIEPERYPLYRGYPTKPVVWVDMAGMVSLHGRSISRRHTPMELITDAETRFVAGHGWSQDLVAWSPLAGPGALLGGAAPQSMPFSLPTGEVLPRSSHRVVNGYLGLDIGNGQMTSPSMTINAVLTVLPTQGVQQLLGFWDMGRSIFHDDDGISWSTDGAKLDYHFGGTGGSVDLLRPLTGLYPLVVTSVIDGDTVTTYLSCKPAEIVATQTRAIKPATQFLRLKFGDVGSDFRLFECSFWSWALDESAVRSLHSSLHGVYGSL